MEHRVFPSGLKRLFFFTVMSGSVILLIYGCGGGGGVESGRNKPANTDHSSAIATWGASTTHVDESSLDDLAGYKIYAGSESGKYTTVFYVGNVTTYKINDLPPGTYFFVVTAYSKSGFESAFSNEVSKTISDR